MKIADDFDAIRQRARELAAERAPAPAQLVGETHQYADTGADVSGHYHLGGVYMIVA